MYEAYLSLIEKTLQETIPDETGALSSVGDMFTYSLGSGGKRVRPLLCLLFCKAVGGDPKKALQFACAVEYIHTYSLIHDDLPCMDNDDFRRGQLSSHNKFGEANALLIGDAMLTDAFGLLTKAADKGDVSPENCLRAVKELSARSGAAGLAGGQIIDVSSEGKAVSGDTLLQMDALKTGALIEAACVLGCLAGNAGEQQITAARNFAQNLGIAFQIIDDLLECENGEEGSDERNQKATYVTVFGQEKAKQLAAEHTNAAISALGIFEDYASEIAALAENLLNRRK